MASIIDGFIDRLQINNGAIMAIGSSAYGICSETASEPNKTVDMTNFYLHEGTTIHVKFLYANSAENPTLNVNSTGAKAIVQYAGIAAGTSSATSGWQAGAVLTLTYDGANWVRDQGYNTDTTYSSLAAAEDGTAVSLVTTGEKYLWNSKTNNVGTVTSIIAGTGLTGGTITDSGTIKANLVSDTALTGTSVSVSEVATRIYPVAIDANGKLAVNVPWEANTETKLIVGKSNSTNHEANNTGEVYLRLFDGDTHRGNIKLVSGNTNMTIISDANGIITFTSQDTTYSVFAGSSTNNGLVPIPSSTSDNNSKWYFLRADGSWAVPEYFTLSAATSDVLGGIKLGYSNNNEPQNYAVQLDSNNKAYVYVPWTDSGNDKVTQTDTDPTTTDTNTYKILFSNVTVASDTDTVTDTARKSASLIFNPSTATLQLAVGNNTATIGPTDYTGNAATATAFASAQSVALTGHITGSNSSTGGWSIATTISSGVITNDMISSTAAIANSKLEHYQMTIAGNLVALGGELSASTLTASLGLSNALHFIGFVDATSTYKPSDGTTKPEDKTLVIEGLDSYTPAAGDVIIDEDAAFEYVYTSSSRWERLGGDASYKVLQTAVTDSDASTAATTTFVQAVTQNANGEITVTKASLNTTGQWAGSAATLTTPREIYVKLGSTRPYSTDNYTQIKFDGSADIGIHVQGVLPISHGGTGTGSITNNAILFATGTTLQYIHCSGHYVDNEALAINSTSIDSNYNFYVHGNSLFDGHLIPTLSTGDVADKTLGTSTVHWGALYVGPSASYGDRYSPIFWSNGVPAVANGTVLNIPFTINDGKIGVKLSSNAIISTSYILQIVVNTGISYLNAPITSTHATGYIQLNTAIATSGVVSGYILVERGGTLLLTGNDALTSEDISSNT